MANSSPYRVAIIGCGGHGEYVARGYAAFPETEIVAIAERSPERRKAMGEQFGVTALYAEVEALLADDVPDIAVIITPCKYYRDILFACAEAGVKGLSTDKPMAAVLSDADEMVQVCQDRGVVYSAGVMQRAGHEAKAAARRLHAGEFGPLTGACVHRLSSEISGGGCQGISMLRLLTGAEVDEVIAWAEPAPGFSADMLVPYRDVGWVISGRFVLSNGLDCPVFSGFNGGIDVWSETALVRWDWGPPGFFSGFSEDGSRLPLEAAYAQQPWPEFVSSLSGSIYSLLAAVETGSEPWASGHDMRQALEVAIACMHSARRGNVPVELPLEDRDLCLYPSPYRWEGADVAARPPGS